MIVLSSAVFFLRLKFSKNLSTGDGGSFVCVIPTYMDSGVLDRSVESLLASEYEDYSVFIVCEEDDSEAIERARSFSDDYDRVDVLVNDRYPGTKAGAMNYAAETTDSDYLAFFDVDQKVSEDFLSGAAYRLGDYDVVQGRNISEPGNFIETLSYYGNVFNYILRQPMSVFTSFALVGGGCSAFKRSSFEKLEGFDERTLAEDYEISHRCYVENLETFEILSMASKEKSASSLSDWWSQMKRWLKGNIQVFALRIRALRNLRKSYRYTASFLIGISTVIGIAFTVTLVSKLLILMFIGIDTGYYVPLISILLLALSARTFDSAFNSIERPGVTWLFTPVIFPLFGLATLKSGIELLLRNTHTWSRVQK